MAIKSSPCNYKIKPLHIVANNDYNETIENAGNINDQIEQTMEFISLVNKQKSFFEDAYKHSLEEANEIHNRVLSHITIFISVIAAGIIYLGNDLSVYLNRHEAIVYLYYFFFSLTLFFWLMSSLTLLKVIKDYKIKGLYAYKYETVMPNVIFNKFKERFIEYCQQNITINQDGLEKLSEHLYFREIQNLYISCATKNRQLNITRFEFLSKSTAYAIRAYATLSVSYIIFFIIKLN